MAEQIKFGDRLYLKGQELILDNGSNNAVIKSIDGTLKVDDNLIVTGNLTVSGTTTTVDSETVTIADNVILLNSNVTGTPSENGGIEIERGTSSNKSFIWNETSDKWSVGSETFVAGTFEGNLTGNSTGIHFGGVDTQGQDLLSTGLSELNDVRIWNGSINDTTIGAITPVAGTFSTITGNGATITNVLTNYTTDALTEGSSNLYFTDARIDAHLNQSNPNSGYVLSWNGTDYVWAPPSINFDKQFSSLLSTPTTLAGYGITDAATSAQGVLADSALQSETISLTALKTEVAASTDFADFQSRIAAL